MAAKLAIDDRLMLELFGTLNVDPDFDYKKQRMRP